MHHQSKTEDVIIRLNAPDRYFLTGILQRSLGNIIKDHFDPRYFNSPRLTKLQSVKRELKGGKPYLHLTAQVEALENETAVGTLTVTFLVDGEFQPNFNYTTLKATLCSQP